MLFLTGLNDLTKLVSKKPVIEKQNQNAGNEKEKEKKNLIQKKNSKLMTFFRSTIASFIGIDIFFPNRKF